MLLSLLALALSATSHAAPLPPPSPEIGNPIYVLEQSEDHTGVPEFSIWEVRAAEKDKTLFSGSRLVYMHKGMRAAEFGFDHVTITPDEITPGTLYIRDTRGKTFKVELELEDRNGRGTMTSVAAAPEGALKGKSDTLETPDLVWQLERDSSGTPQTLTRLEKSTGKRNKMQLSGQLTAEQGGQEFQFMGSGEGLVYARVGNHYMSFSPASLGSALVSRNLAPTFFGEGLRTYGVNYTRFSEILVMQPQNADRAGLKRCDVKTRDFSLEKTDEPLINGTAVAECDFFLGDAHGLSFTSGPGSGKTEQIKRIAEELKKDLHKLGGDDKFPVIDMLTKKVTKK